MDLILLVCLTASPAECREERVAISYELIDPRACMVGAAPVIADWSGDHPEYRITRWKCSASATAQLTRKFD